MKSSIIAGIGFAVLLGSLFFFLSERKSQFPKAISGDLYKEWQNWKIKYGKNYPSNDEEFFRINTFANNFKKINTHNSLPSKSYTMKVNQFADLTAEEAQSLLLSRMPIPTSANENIGETPSITAPASWDWKKEKPGSIRRIRHQGMCGSCWAFSAIGAVEGISFIFKGIGDEFSEQQLIDCSDSYGNKGCDGGWMTYAFGYIRDRGITTEKEYPYEGRDLPECKKQGGAFKISGFVNVAKGNVEALKTSIVAQPTSVGVDAQNWTFYDHGIFDDCYDDLNHGVLVYGYDQNCWYVKNSWGEDWGEKGYIRLKMGNTCGILTWPSYPKV